MDNKVKKRAVFYISGYDLRGARYYHNLYTKEASKQSEIKDYSIKTSSRKKVTPVEYKWDVEFTKGKDVTSTEYHYLDYSRLIKRSWPRTTLAILKDVVYSYSALFKYKMLQSYKVHWPMAVLAILPLIVLILNILCSIGVGGLVFRLSPEGIDLLKWVLSIGSAMAVLYLGTFLDKKLNHYWMIRAISFVALLRYTAAKDSDELLQTFSETIKDAAEGNEFDEILVVCHSIGSVIGVDVVSRLVESIEHPKVELITLGGCVASVLMNPQATDFRKRTKKVMHQKSVRWTDAGAWADGACMCGVHPNRVLKEAPSVQPQVTRVKFYKDFSEASYKSLKKDRLRLHFQYILSNEGMDRYDYFAMTAGEQYFQPKTYLYNEPMSL